MKVLLIIAYLLPSGQLGLEISQLPSCPPKEDFQKFMEQQVKENVITTYSVDCRPMTPTTGARN